MEELSKIWPGWQFEELIGQGAFGKVYKAKKESYHQIIEAAVKVIRIPSEEDELDELDSGMSAESMKEYFQNLTESMISEISLMVKMRADSHIVSVEDWEVVENSDGVGQTVYIRMELLENLNHYFKNHPPMTEDIVRLGISICTALEYCHSQKILHRDIKPANIFATSRGDFKLGDFGVARQMERTNSSLSQKGTRSYMAPEMLRMEKNYNQTVDRHAERT